LDVPASTVIVLLDAAGMVGGGFLDDTMGVGFRLWMCNSTEQITRRVSVSCRVRRGRKIVCGHWLGV